MMDAFTFLELFVPLFAIFGNMIALDGVVMGDISIAGYRRFLISLLASDLYICVVKLLLVVVEKIAHSHFEINMQMHKCIGELGRSLEITGFIAYLLNLCGMFVDHYIALLHAHRYKYLMDKRPARWAVFLIWPAAFIIGFADHPVRALAHWALKGDTSSSSSASSASNSADFATLSSVNCSMNSGSMSYSYDNYNADATAGNNDDDFDPWANTDFSNPCRSDSLNATWAVLNAVRQGLDFESGNNKRNLIICASFDRTSKLWLDWIVVILALGAATFLSICYWVFRKAVERAGRAKSKLQKLSITTFLLLGAFIVCWMPYTCYELFMELIFQTSQNILTADSSQIFFVVHNFLHLLFICSPLLVPIIYVTRLRVVQRQILKRYSPLMPPCLKRRLNTQSLRISASSVAETTSLCIQSTAFPTSTTTMTMMTSSRQQYNKQQPSNNNNVELQIEGGTGGGCDDVTMTSPCSILRQQVSSQPSCSYSARASSENLDDNLNKRNSDASCV